jgi:hypothetical protein
MLTCTYVKEDLVKILVQILEIVDPNINSRFQFLAEIISEVHEPMTEVSVELPADEIRKKQLMVRMECYKYVTHAHENLFCLDVLTLSQTENSGNISRQDCWIAVRQAPALHPDCSFGLCHKQISINYGVNSVKP